MSRFIILLGGKLVLHAAPRGAGGRRARHRGRRRHAACQDARHHAGTVGRAISIPSRRSSRPSSRPFRRSAIPPDKDKTDGELAVAEALARGATSLVLAGAFGGTRADHAFLHLALAHPARQGRAAGHPHQRRAGRPSAAAGLARLRLRRRHAVQHPRLLASVRPVRDGREMAARQRRGAVRLLADPIQRSARRPRASRSPSAAPCCSRIPIRPQTALLAR